MKKITKLICINFIFLSFIPIFGEEKFLSLHHLLEFIDKATEVGYKQEELEQINLKNRYNTIQINNINELKEVITEEIGYDEELLRSIKFDILDETIDAVTFIRTKIKKEEIDPENALEDSIFSGEDLLSSLTKLEQRKLSRKRKSLLQFILE